MSSTNWRPFCLGLIMLSISSQKLIFMRHTHTFLCFIDFGFKNYLPYLLILFKLHYWPWGNLMIANDCPSASDVTRKNMDKYVICSLQNKIWNLPDRSTILSKLYMIKKGSLPVWDDISTPTIFWPRGQNIVTIYWPPLQYFDSPMIINDKDLFSFYNYLIKYVILSHALCWFSLLIG